MGIDKPSAPVDMNNHNSPVLSEFVQQHLASEQRSQGDAKDARTYPPVDNAAATTIQNTASVDGQILALVKAGKPIPQSLMDSAIALHTASTADAQRDRSGDNDALKSDAAGVKAEQAVIDADNALIKSGKIDPALMKALKADVANKQQLAANDQRDYANEASYIRHDIADIATNDRVIKALKGNQADLIPALEASIASKANTRHDRLEDAALEPKYAADDDKDAHMNRMLLNAVQNPGVWAHLYHPNS